jgi:hypothetical protein
MTFRRQRIRQKYRQTYASIEVLYRSFVREVFCLNLGRGAGLGIEFSQYWRLSVPTDVGICLRSDHLTIAWESG